MLISLVAVGLVLVTTSGCDSAGAGGNSDPILSLSPIVVPTFSNLGATTTAQMSPAMVEWVDNVDDEGNSIATADEGFNFVNSFNQSTYISYPNAVLTAIQRQIRAGLDPFQPFTMNTTSIEGTDEWEVWMTLKKSSSGGNTTYIGYYDEALNGSLEHPDDGRYANDTPLVMIFSADYKKLYATGKPNETSAWILDHDYAAGKTLFLYYDWSSGDQYFMESFHRGGSSTVTYHTMEYGGGGTFSQYAVMHMIAGTGIIHYVEPDSAASSTWYLTSSGSETTFSGTDKTSLDNALSSFRDGLSPNDPETEWAARHGFVPDYSTSEYQAVLSAHQANFAH
jgi:hypothetical protein